MRANLPNKEPEILDFWNKIDVYARVQEKNAGKPTFILHDGPPYANGDIHLGHTLNKVLKDMIIKHRSMSGYDSPYIPGWDTHGLPIEQALIKEPNNVNARFNMGLIFFETGDYKKAKEYFDFVTKINYIRLQYKPTN